MSSGRNKYIEIGIRDINGSQIIILETGSLSSSGGGGGGSPTGPAGGNLTGTYPNPNVIGGSGTFTGTFTGSVNGNTFMFPPTYISGTEGFLVPDNEQVLIAKPIRVSGTLKIKGTLVETVATVQTVLTGTFIGNATGTFTR